MERQSQLERDIFSVQNTDGFEQVALRVFEFQYAHCATYRQYCDLTKRTNPQSSRQIPHIPIQFFKSKKIYCGNTKPELLFKSSGTTSVTRSQHSVRFESVYSKSFSITFSHFFGDIHNHCILALLPSYQQQGFSSLVHMVDGLIQQSNSSHSGFLLHDYNEVALRIREAKREGRKIILFGVSYALLDLADQALDLQDVIVIETGGMKGRREEWSKEKLHQYLSDQLNEPDIYSEYGMTELLSQGYAKKDQGFVFPNWMKCHLRQTDDPFEHAVTGTGAVNISDLANLYSCSFIATDDLGKVQNGQLYLKGRLDHSDIRGCNLMVE